VHHTALLELSRRRQAGGPGTDDDRYEAFCVFL
jgi:hypothetical protein